MIPSVMTKVSKVKTAEPIITTYETVTPGLTDADVGQKMKAVLTYEVIERTKSFAILKIHYVHVVTNKRNV